MNKFKQYCIVGASIVFIVVIFVLVFVLLGWEHIKDGLEYLSTEWPRNVIIGIGAIATLVIAYYRSNALQKRAEAANEQAKIANQQADLAEKRYASEQFSQSVTLLAKDNQDKPAIEARIGGVYALATLAESDPKGYGAQVMKTLVAYIRNNAQLTALPVPSKKNKDKSTLIPEERSKSAHLGMDVKTAFAELKRLHSNEKVRKDSDVNDDDLSFSYADFRVLRLNEIEWIEKPNLLRADLSGANLRVTNLQGVNLEKANLQGAYLKSANLQGANLEKANLQGAYLKSANLQGANLEKANLQGANLEKANLQGAYLKSANLQGANLEKANLQGANLEKANLQGAYLKSANLQGAKLEGANLKGANLRWASLQKTKLTNVKAIYTAFEKAGFNDTVFKFDNTDEECKVWHSKNSFWDSCRETEGFESLEKDIKWNLNLIFPGATEPSDVVFVLEGILRNFAEKGDNKLDPRAIECRKAVKQWVIDHNLWDHLSGGWRDWLKSLDDEGRAPDDK